MVEAKAKPKSRQKKVVETPVGESEPPLAPEAPEAPATEAEAPEPPALPEEAPPEEPAPPEPKPKAKRKPKAVPEPVAPKPKAKGKKLETLSDKLPPPVPITEVPPPPVYQEPSYPRMTQAEFGGMLSEFFSATKAQRRDARLAMYRSWLDA